MSTATDVMNEPAAARKMGPIGFGLRALAIWVTILVATVGAQKVFPIDMAVPAQDGPLSMPAAFLLVNGLMAFALSLVAARARVTGWRLALLIFIAFFGISTAMMQIETLYFNDSVKMPMPIILALVGQAALVAAVTGIVAALLFRTEAEPASGLPSHMSLRVAAMAVVYVGLYYAAGYFIAWQSEAVRAYYNNGVNIETLPTVAFQIFRGTLWALITLYIVSRMKGSLASRTAVMAVLFPALTATLLLYPNPMVPWIVRQAHLVEVATSEFAYGIIATLVLLAGAARSPLAANSAWRLITGRA